MITRKHQYVCDQLVHANMLDFIHYAFYTKIENANVKLYKFHMLS